MLEIRRAIETDGQLGAGDGDAQGVPLIGRRWSFLNPLDGLSRSVHDLEESDVVLQCVGTHQQVISFHAKIESNASRLIL